MNKEAIKGFIAWLDGAHRLIDEELLARMYPGAILNQK